MTEATVIEATTTTDEKVLYFILGRLCERLRGPEFSAVSLVSKRSRELTTKSVCDEWEATGNGAVHTYVREKNKAALNVLRTDVRSRSHVHWHTIFYAALYEDRPEIVDGIDVSILFAIGHRFRCGRILASAGAASSFDAVAYAKTVPDEDLRYMVATQSLVARNGMVRGADKLLRHFVGSIPPEQERLYEVCPQATLSSASMAPLPASLAGVEPKWNTKMFISTTTNDLATMSRYWVKAAGFFAPSVMVLRLYKSLEQPIPVEFIAVRYAYGAIKVNPPLSAKMDEFADKIRRRAIDPDLYERGLAFLDAKDEAEFLSRAHERMFENMVRLYYKILFGRDVPHAPDPERTELRSLLGAFASSMGIRMEEDPYVVQVAGMTFENNLITGVVRYARLLRCDVTLRRVVGASSGANGTLDVRKTEDDRGENKIRKHEKAMWLKFCEECDKNEVVSEYIKRMICMFGFAARDDILSGR